MEKPKRYSFSDILEFHDTDKAIHAIDFMIKNFRETPKEVNKFLNKLSMDVEKWLGEDAVELLQLKRIQNIAFLNGHSNKDISFCASLINGDSVVYNFARRGFNRRLFCRQALSFIPTKLGQFLLKEDFFDF